MYHYVSIWNVKTSPQKENYDKKKKTLQDYGGV